jgi:hypothetical protein
MMLLHMYSRTGWSARKLRKACLALLLATPGHFSRQLPSANFVFNMLVSEVIYRVRRRPGRLEGPICRISCSPHTVLQRLWHCRQCHWWCSEVHQLKTLELSQASSQPCFRSVLLLLHQSTDFTPSSSQAASLMLRPSLVGLDVVWCGCLKLQPGEGACGQVNK